MMNKARLTDPFGPWSQIEVFIAEKLQGLQTFKWVGATNAHWLARGFTLSHDFGTASRVRMPAPCTRHASLSSHGDLSAGFS